MEIGQPIYLIATGNWNRRFEWLRLRILHVKLLVPKLLRTKFRDKHHNIVTALNSINQSMYCSCPDIRVLIHDSTIVLGQCWYIVLYYSVCFVVNELGFLCDSSCVLFLEPLVPVRTLHGLS